MDYEKLRQRLLARIDEEEDSLRIYRLHTPKGQFIEHYGVTREIDFNGPLIA